MDLAFNNLPWLICHKTQPTHTHYRLFISIVNWGKAIDLQTKQKILNTNILNIENNIRDFVKNTSGHYNNFHDSNFQTMVKEQNNFFFTFIL